MALTVMRPGLLTTVQDLGRPAYQQHGVVSGGVMDEGAARVANLLVGNDEEMAVLELTMAGAELRTDEDIVIAICGGDMVVVADGESVPLWRPVLWREGSVLSFLTRRSGCRAYLAVSGGIDVPLVMGSRSTYLRAGIGGLDGRALRKGDKLSMLLSAPGSKQAQVMHMLRGQGGTSPWHAGHFATMHTPMHVIRIMPGTHLDRLSEEGKRALLQMAFQVGVRSDRMGYRLEGAALRLNTKDELLSEAVAAGTIQVPGDEQPIVLLADRQTTGGYPRVAQVAAVDLPIFAGLKPGDEVRFQLITHQEAERLLLQRERDIDVLKAGIALKMKKARAVSAPT
ncbi:biotin-dependent carboxyltransferase family protein [Paenibacillus sp. J5C_2022]|uniref:5-oxoprolinase subunit C family protein n=1 Tax=Paenibacillus sp. J5C2022 TaxID=2977129 RepID=UPI0021CFD790|nr:biotin-dependent carboxyltransferase family protein [Paenibacillus sp. J5C2022]MCU6711230.1 biotin-dependent carboxyltransferase family protein [Paenibacillus sp. J5C2022]